jgi:tRNA wybutosine-synthesizing protein 2
MRQIPSKRIKTTLSSVIPPPLMKYLPEKWEKIGTVVIIRVPEELHSFMEIIGRTYAETLGCTTTLNDVGGISGVYRNPVVDVIYGSPMTETIHVENGIRFKVDPQKIMFSSGNMAERRRMGRIAGRDETVVDMFAGIGYFSLSMAVYSKPQKIIACELNPFAFSFLQANVVLNNVCSIVEPVLGDNRIVAPKDRADRVLLGYLNNPQKYLPAAFECLRNQEGFLHYHELVPIESIPEQPLSHVQTAAQQFHRSVELVKVQKIKSYAPGIHHVVLDVRSVK